MNALVVGAVLVLIAWGYGVVGVLVWGGWRLAGRLEAGRRPARVLAVLGAVALAWGWTWVTLVA